MPALYEEGPLLLCTGVVRSWYAWYVVPLFLVVVGAVVDGVAVVANAVVVSGVVGVGCVRSG